MNTQIQSRALEIFNNIVNDILYVWDNVPREVAEKAAITFIRNPQQLIELSELVKEKRRLG
jgi:hypothetical protein